MTFAKKGYTICPAQFWESKVSHEESAINEPFSGILQPYIGNILSIKSDTTSRAFPASIFNVLINALFAKHVPTPKENAFLVSVITHRTS